MTINEEVLSNLAKASHDSYGKADIEIAGYKAIEYVVDPGTGFSFTLYESESTKEYIFAFAGTESIQDVYADLTLGMAQWSGQSKAEIWKLLTKIADGNSDVELHFTGHSLGGALAQYAAYEYAYAVANPENGQNLQASFDLVTFNALGGKLALSDPDLYGGGFDAALAESIDAAHFKIGGDLVSRLGDDHVGGELLVIDKSYGSPFWSHDIAHFTTGVPGSFPVTTADFASARAEDDYLAIKQPMHVSGIVASWGDDGSYTEEEALLRTIAAFAFGLANSSYADLGALVTSFFGDPETIGQDEYDALKLVGETAIIALQSSQLGVVNVNGVGAYALALANILQFSAQLWEEHPGIADALGMSIDTFVERVGGPATELASAALDYALSHEFVEEEYQDAVDFISNTARWMGNFFSHQPINGMYIQGTEADDVLRTRDNYWPWKTNDDQLHGYAGDDILEGGAGADFLVGGAGADSYLWNTADGHDTIGDYDDGGDRIIVNGTDLAQLNFKRISVGSPFYRDAAQPELTLHYDGTFLTIAAGTDAGKGSITVKEYLPVIGADFGIVLHDYNSNPPSVTDLAVVEQGAGDHQIDSSAYWRQQSSQGGLEWADMAIRFNAADVVNYNEGTLHGTSGGAFEGGPLADHLTGDAGANALHGLGGADTLEGEAGDDFLEGGAGWDLVSGGDGNDLLFGSARTGLAATLDSGSAHDQFYLSQSFDERGDINRLDAGAGDDHVSGGEHTDYIAGGAGVDYLLGGTGDDFIGGGDDRDIIYGDSSLHYRYVELAPGSITERIEIAFAGGDDLVGQYDDDIRAGAGNDTVWGELGDDTLYGGEGDDNLLGDRADDPDYFSAELPAYGATTPELLSALHGDDRLYGGGGSDLLVGHAGNDLLAGGKGADSLIGGAGDDHYVFQSGDALDYIQDYQGTHTLLFEDVAASDLQVLFQGDKVLVGTGYGAEGFYLSRSEWSAVRVALGSTDTVIEKSRLDTYYFDNAGNPLLTVLGNSELSEAERDALFKVDATDPQHPTITVGSGVDTVAIEALAGGSGGAIMRVGSGGLQWVVELAARQVASGLDFLSLADGPLMSLVGFSGQLYGTTGADSITGSELVDVVYAGRGNDVVEGRGGNDSLYGGDDNDVISGEDGDDYLDGGQGWDVLRGGRGRDTLYGGQFTESDYLEGGPGNDVLNGGSGRDTYRFNSGDGLDLLEDSNGSHFLEFGVGVDPQSVVMYYTGTTDSQFRLEYGQGDAVSSAGVTSAYWINGVTVDGTAIPLVQRSELVDASFEDTRWNDVIEGGAGNDIMFSTGWGEDVYRFFTGDGQDLINAKNAYYPEFMGHISLAPDVDLGSVSVSVQNGLATIAYGAGDQIALATEKVFSSRDNVIGRFTLVSEADPDWMPIISSPDDAGNLYGTFGSDHIIGGSNIDTILPGYGDDVIEAGDGADHLILNEGYFFGGDGIGHKKIFAGAGDDLIQAPLHQGLSFHYQPGDGDDTIAYDWSYSGRPPYAFDLDYDENTVAFRPYGHDSLVFGDGITLGDLRFDRSGDTLDIALLDGSGSVSLEEFFHAWDVELPAPPVGPDDLFGEGSVSDTLLYPGFLGLLPRSPIATIGFADGSVYDMNTVLESLLDAPTVTPPDEEGELFEGTRGKDQLTGTDGNDTFIGGAGRDTINGLAGDDVIIGGAGGDVLSGGQGNDRYVFAAGDGRDTINNNGVDLQDTDILQLDDISYDQVWLSRNRKHLFVNIAGSRDRVRIKDWFINETDQLDAIHVGDRVLMQDQVDQLVNAMAAFDVPQGVGVVISEQAREALEPTLASVWQMTG